MEHTWKHNPTLYCTFRNIHFYVYGRDEESHQPVNHVPVNEEAGSEEYRERQIRFLEKNHGMPVYALNQLHGIKNVQAPFASGSKDPEADALWTEQTNTLLCIRTADCLPVFWAACKGSSRRTGIIHAGWKGLASNIIGNVFSNLRQWQPDEIFIAPGPAISTDNYEVGADVADKFAIVKRKGKSYYVDLLANALMQIRKSCNETELTVNQEMFYCTLEDDRFYSHRAGDSGRNLNIACIMNTKQIEEG